MLAIEYLVAEGWVGPAITMVVNTISPANKGFAVSAWLFMCTVAGTIANALLGQLQSHYIDKEDASTNKYYGTFLCYFVIFSYGGSLPFFWLAGRSYTQVKEKEARESEAREA